MVWHCSCDPYALIGINRYTHGKGAGTSLKDFLSNGYRTERHSQDTVCIFRRDNVASRFRIVIAIGLVVSLFTASFSAMAQEDNNDNGVSYDHDFNIHGFDFHEPEFYNVWARTDLPVLQGEVERSWLWGPAANTEVFEEPYAEAVDGMREVQYSDKSRMEMPVPGSAAAADDEDSPWNITQGLLATELMTGQLQLGDDTFEQYAPAEIPVAGDWEDNPGPTYADMAAYMDYGARTTGWDITQYFDEDGVVRDDDRFADYDVYDRYYIPETDHNIASVFWDFMQSEGLIYDGEGLSEGPLFLNEFYAIGFPITEAYWGEFRLRGEVQDILVQCFERRCLTYAPNNPVEWQVESGNVGLHYHMWRYTQIGEPIVPEPEPELSLTLAQEDDVNEFGTDHTFTATLAENGDAVNFDDDDEIIVSIERDGDAVVFEEDDLDIAVENNVATITYSGPAEGTDDVVDTIDVSVDIDGDVVHGTPTLTKTWTAAEPVPELGLELFQEEDTNIVGTDHTFTATLTENGTEVDIADGSVLVTVHRDGATVPVAFEDNEIEIDIADNVATITYAGPDEPAVDEIDVSVEVNDTMVDAAQTLTKTWVTAFDYYECDVLVEDDESIQDAINAADENDVICVESGTYSENIDVNVDGITLIALDGPEETTIQSNTTDQGGVVALTADDVTISGFTVDNQNAEDGRAIRVHDSTDGVTIENNILVNALRGVQGNWTGGASNVTITGNIFNVAFGIAGTEDVDGLVVTGNTFNTTEEGIGLGGGLDNWEIQTNQFAGQGDHVADYRTPAVAADLEAIIVANTFANPVHVVGGDTIRDQ
jgi:hypothetical protein